MDCENYEKLIIDSGGNRLSDAEAARLDAHLRECLRCSRFKEEMKRLHAFIDTSSPPELPRALDSRTRSLCHERLRSIRSAAGRAGRTPIPGFVWTALYGIILITGFLALPYVKELRGEGPLSYQTLAALALVIQNGIMLLLSPVLNNKGQGGEGLIGKRSLSPQF
ncbi:MAG: zf-HC2 domain-containing protein, partial [Acidobacteria bacterium]|nr:zf-HC2 domain-containing protein [Acidobacteriota bacterium]